MAPSHGKEMRKKWKQWETIFLSSKITADGDCSCQIKRHLLLGRKAMTNLDSIIKKQRHYIVNKGSSTQSCGFSSSQVWMWELDYKVLGSFNGPEPGGPESMIRKWKRERGWYSLVYAENQQSPWHRACIAHKDTRRPLERGKAQGTFSRGS